jgi:hypothetical protein
MAQACGDSFRCYLEQAALVNNGGWYIEPSFARTLLQPTGELLCQQHQVQPDRATTLSALPWLIRTTTTDNSSELQVIDAAEPLFFALLRRIDQWLSPISNDFTPWPMQPCGALLEGLLVTIDWLKSRRQRAAVLVGAIATSQHAAVVLIDSLFRVLEHRGVQHLLGIRTTKGTVVYALPPSALSLLAAFEVSQAPSNSTSAAALTVGARAWTKHCHRSGDGWWGVSRGGMVDLSLYLLYSFAGCLPTCVNARVTCVFVSFS